MEILEHLNSEQKKAVMHTEGQLLLLAGAGSGKTRVITHRIAYMIKEKHISPYSIIAITFTNKAAKEMKQRVSDLLGDDSIGIWIGTFHWACLRILRADAEKLGYKKNFVIFDSNDQRSLIKQCIKELNLNTENFPERNILSQIGREKDERVTPEKYLAINGGDYHKEKIGEIYSLYQKKLFNSNAMDFDDIILNTLKLLEQEKDIRKYYQEKFKYVMIDEYQDTNTAQYVLSRYLSAGYGNLCVVGDDDQTIYGWRGANIRNILDFEKDNDNCTVIKLEQNYRSTGNILKAANAVIKNNVGRKIKQLWTESGEGEKINCIQIDSEHEEARYIVSKIKEMTKLNEYKFGQIAILYRMNAQSRVLEGLLVREGVPYAIYGGLKFYDRKEVKDLLAYIRLALNIDDSISFLRAVNIPRRGVGKTTLSKIQGIATSEDINMLEASKRFIAKGDNKKSAKGLADFLNIINSIQEMRTEKKATEFVTEAIILSGLEEWYKNDDPLTAQERIENIRELVSAVNDFENSVEESDEEIIIEQYLSNITLSADIDYMEDETQKVSLMTLHSAKGLEFDVVFIPGFEEGVFPSQRADLEENKIEEERRLCYVGITRAKKIVYLTSCNSRNTYGQTTYNRPSRFLSEIPKELIKGQPTKKGVSVSKGKKKSAFELTRGGKPFNMNGIAGVKGDIPSLIKGDRVTHKKFGEGTVLKIMDKGDQEKIEINFDEYGMKRLMSAYAKLNKIEN